MRNEEIEQKSEEWANLYYTKDSESVSVITEDAEWHNRRFNFQEGSKWALEQLDQETQRLKAELAEKDKLYQISDNKVAILQSELTELKEKHKRDVVGFAEWILKQSDLQNLKMYEDSFVVFKQGSAFGKTLTPSELIDHYNETHKTK